MNANMSLPSREQENREATLEKESRDIERLSLILLGLETIVIVLFRSAISAAWGSFLWILYAPLALVGIFLAIAIFRRSKGFRSKKFRGFMLGVVILNTYIIIPPIYNPALRGTIPNYQ